MRSRSYPLRESSPSRSLRFKRRAVFFSLLVAGTLILLPTTALASPPDPTWMDGIYDGSDGDDVVCLVYEVVATNAGLPSYLPPVLRLPELSLERFVVSYSRLVQSLLSLASCSMCDRISLYLQRLVGYCIRPRPSYSRGGPKFLDMPLAIWPACIRLEWQRT